MLPAVHWAIKRDHQCLEIIHFSQYMTEIRRVCLLNIYKFP